MTFEELDLNDNVLDALYDMRFETCTPIQEHCIPQILEGQDRRLPPTHHVDARRWRVPTRCHQLHHHVADKRVGAANRSGYAGIWLLSR